MQVGDLTRFHKDEVGVLQMRVERFDPGNQTGILDMVQNRWLFS